MKITILFIDLFDHDYRDNVMSSCNKKRTYVYNSPHKVTEDENVSSEAMNIGSNIRQFIEFNGFLNSF